MFSSTRIIVTVFVASFTLAEGKGDCKEKLYGTIIPQYANNVTDTTAMKIEYPGGNKVDCGNKLGAIVTIPVPTVKYDVHSKCANATILFIGIPYNFYDTDSIVGFPYLHWLVHNVPAKILRRGFSVRNGYPKAYVKTDYLFPLNPLNDHRYTFFVYCQEHYIKPEGKKNGLLLQRPSFQPKEYAAQYGLGDPLAINYFVSTVVSGVGFPPSLTKVD